ncbi:hypothetical protein NPIL_520461 [Nephila pilipes]|uniref:Uncharacterized protein n=1 Tax=Nephila pilipes TaxID=299642 RepID=A0A8X6ND79_NEPPI|nr:hypothetical protein NPIL_520461 [Nephila pilipes]
MTTQNSPLNHLPTPALSKFSIRRRNPSTPTLLHSISKIHFVSQLIDYEDSCPPELRVSYTVLLLFCLEKEIRGSNAPEKGQHRMSLSNSLIPEQIFHYGCREFIRVQTGSDVDEQTFGGRIGASLEIFFDPYQRSFSSAGPIQ